MPQNPLLNIPLEDPNRVKPLKPIKEAYGPYYDPSTKKYGPNKPELNEPVADFILGFTGLGKGMVDRDASDASFLGDALGNINPGKLMMMPIAGVTKFIKPLIEGGRVIRVPDKARRVIKTEENLVNLEKFLRSTNASEEDIQAALKIYGNYPRTTAHIDKFEKSFDPTHLGYMKAEPATNLSRQNIEIGLNPDKLDRIRLYDPNSLPYAETATHELIHTGQSLPNPERFNLQYNQNREKFGYVYQPEETSAFSGAKRRVREVQAKPFSSNEGSKIKYLPMEEGKPLKRVVSEKLGNKRYQLHFQEMGSGDKNYVTKSIKISTKPYENISEAFSKSPQVINELHKKPEPLNIKQQLLDSLKEQKKNK
jgi:hypothetical protein